MAENKVQFNLKNLHYAVMKTGGESPTWDTPVPIPGAVNLALEQQGEITKFYADGMIYYQCASNNGYEGDLEVARFPDQMMQDIWKMIKVQTDNVIIENANEEPAAFALLFQIDGDAEERYGVLYNCSATRPGVGSKTLEGTKEPQTQSTTVSAVPLANGSVKACTCADTPAEVKAEWFKKVYEPKKAA